MTKSKIIRSDPYFKKMLKEVKLAKIKNGTANDKISDRRLTLAIARTPNLKDFLINSKMREDMR